jgi:hypothetical protein
MSRSAATPKRQMVETTDQMIDHNSIQKLAALRQAGRLRGRRIRLQRISVRLFKD